MEEQTMLRKWLRLLYTAALMVGVLLSFFAAVEVLRAFQTLHGLHPAAGYAFLGLIALLVAWVLWRVGRGTLAYGGMRE